jgi:hypothetical protein
MPQIRYLPFKEHMKKRKAWVIVESSSGKYVLGGFYVKDINQAELFDQRSWALSEVSGKGEKVVPVEITVTRVEKKAKRKQNAKKT